MIALDNILEWCYNLYQIKIMNIDNKKRPGNYMAALFGNPEINIVIPNDVPLMFDIQSRVDTCATLHGDKITIAVPLPTRYVGKVLRRLWRYKFEVEHKTLEDGRDFTFLRFIRRRKFFFF